MADDEIERFAAAARTRRVRILIVTSIVAIALGIAITLVILTAGDTTGYSFVGHPARPYGSWTKLFAVVPLGFIAVGIGIAVSAVRLRRRG
jgi:hypothetical protein